MPLKDLSCPRVCPDHLANIARPSGLGAGDREAIFTPEHAQMRGDRIGRVRLALPQASRCLRAQEADGQALDASVVSVSCPAAHRAVALRCFVFLGIPSQVGIMTGAVPKCLVQQSQKRFGSRRLRGDAQEERALQFKQKFGTTDLVLACRVELDAMPGRVLGRFGREPR